MAPYQSEVTLFLNQLKQEHPRIEAEQRKGRAIWWDAEPLNMDRLQRDRDSKVAQNAYPYQTRG